MARFMPFYDCKSYLSHILSSFIAPISLLITPAEEPRSRGAEELAGEEIQKTIQPRSSINNQQLVQV
jgi:hypothetical protein